MSVNRDLKVAMEGHKTTSAGRLFGFFPAASYQGMEQSVPYSDSCRKEAVLKCIDGPGWNLEFMTMSSGAASVWNESCTVKYQQCCRCHCNESWPLHGYELAKDPWTSSKDMDSLQQIGDGTTTSWRQAWKSAEERGHRGESWQRTTAVYAS